MMALLMRRNFDVLIIGTGAAGLTLALQMPNHLQVAVLSKAKIGAGSTKWAQGGIAAVLESSDSLESHVDDTLIAGAGLCDEEAVRFVVERGPEAIEQLITLGVDFDKADKLAEDGYGYHLTREGGHSHRRIIHAADATGRAVQHTLNDRVREAKNIHIFTDYMAIDLITNRNLKKDYKPDSEQVHGAYVLNLKLDRVETLSAKATVIATGGASRVYQYSSNPDAATGDGIAMAWRAGCRVTNMEFNQFHPTCLYNPEAKTYLITEAMRGEGAILRLPDGEAFMERYDSRAELAPRDIVARAIDAEMKRLGVAHLYLDITHRDPDFVISHFPNIYRHCLEFDIDITRDPIPIVPAAHYTCGGIKVDVDGRTDVDRLYAIGECSATGLHGANRMASNSLLECLVYGQSAARHIADMIKDIPQLALVRDWDESQVANSDEMVVVTHNWAEVRRFMWDYVGIVRTDKRLARAKNRVDLLSKEIEEYYGNFRVTADLLELRNLVTVADLIVRSAQKRKESRGLHYTVDYPDLLEKAENTVLVPYKKHVLEQL